MIFGEYAVKSLCHCDKSPNDVTMKSHNGSQVTDILRTAVKSPGMLVCCRWYHFDVTWVPVRKLILWFYNHKEISQGFTRFLVSQSDLIVKAAGDLSQNKSHCDFSENYQMGSFVSNNEMHEKYYLSIHSSYCDICEHLWHQKDVTSAVSAVNVISICLLGVYIIFFWILTINFSIPKLAICICY